MTSVAIDTRDGGFASEFERFWLVKMVDAVQACQTELLVWRVLET